MRQLPPPNHGRRPVNKTSSVANIPLMRSLDAAVGGSPAGDSLVGLMSKATRVRSLIEECSTELAEVNAGMKHTMRVPELSAGAQDVLQKNQAVEEKVSEVASRIDAINDDLSGELRDRSLLKQMMASVEMSEASARHMALHDALTGLPNRALLDDRLVHGLAMATRQSWGMAVMFLDLDAFKQINDTYGHAAGDRVLKVVSKRLIGNTRSDDTASRYGGDEFVYLMMDVKSEDDVAQFAQMLLESLHMPCEVRTNSATVSLQVKVSIGIALFPQHSCAADELMHLADAAMYKAKRSGSGYAFAS